MLNQIFTNSDPSINPQRAAKIEAFLAEMFQHPDLLALPAARKVLSSFLR